MYGIINLYNFTCQDKIQRIYIEKWILKIKDVIDRNSKFKTMEEITGEFLAYLAPKIWLEQVFNISVAAILEMSRLWLKYGEFSWANPQNQFRIHKYI